MSHQPKTNDRWFELLAQRATEGLSDADTQAFEAAQDEYGATEAEEFELAAAALAEAMAISDEIEPMPDAVRQRLDQVADRWIEAQTPAPIPISRGRGGVLSWTGWAVAAAAILVAFVISLPGGKTDTNPAAMRTALLSSQQSEVSGWISLPDSPLGLPTHQFDKGIAGDVVWDESADEGYMRISGLAINDPTKYQYQLWVFDATRPPGEQYADAPLDILKQYPVDGGVFDVTTTGEIVIPIDAKLPVNDAVIFAVTVEPPGGSVVSQRDVVFLAAL